MINEGDNCIILYSIKNDDVYKMMTIKKNKEVKINKHTFKWDNCIGQPYGWVKKHEFYLVKCSLTWFIENRGLHIETDYKVQNTVEKLLLDKESAIDNRNQFDRNKDAEQMAKVRKDVESLRESGASQDAILATVIG